MTRVLSELLSAPGPQFQRTLQQLETMTGHPKADIRLTGDIQQAMHHKLRELRLDASDTSGPELYAALRQRLYDDEQAFLARLKPAADEQLTAQIVRLFEHQVSQRRCYGLKATVARRILKANLPRKTMKVLGYRSADSMLKHETPASLYAAAWLVESSQWAKRIIAAYAKLGANDFEQRDLVIEHPTSKRWQTLSQTVVAQRKHHVLSFKELGAVVLLPLPAERPPLAALTTAVLTLHAVNEVRAAGTFLKLHQLQSGFGTIVQQIVLAEPMLPAASLDRPVSWHSLQQYVSRYGDELRSNLFEPLLQLEELAWTSVEDVLTAIEPQLSFWRQTAHLGALHSGQVVSCNLSDALLNHSNALPFAARSNHYFQQALRSELFLRYLSHGSIDQLVIGDLYRNYATEMIDA